MTCESRGFQAFDGSNKYYKKFAVYDVDCCYLPGSPRGRPPDDDGYYIIEKRQATCGCCPSGGCVVVESVRWFAANGYAVGTVLICPNTPAYSAPGVFNSATKRSILVNDACCNADGSKIYAELTEEIDCGNPLP